MYFQGAAPRSSLNTAEQFTWRIGTNTETRFNTKRQTGNKQIDRQTEREAEVMYKTNQHTADRANQRRKEDGQTARRNHPNNERQLCIFSRCGNAQYELTLQVATVQLVLSAQRQKERGCKGGL